MDTYTVSSEGRGKISTSFDHMDDRLKHIYLPSRDITHYDDLSTLQTDAEYELWKLAHQDHARDINQEFHHLNRKLDNPSLSAMIPQAHLLRDTWAAVNLPFWDNLARARELQASKDNGENQPFHMIKHLIFNADAEFVEATAHDFVHTPDAFNGVARANEALLQARLDFEQCCGLFLRWDMMPQLESLFVDLRAYSVGYVGTEVLEQAAANMSSSGLQLKLLVLVGLRSEEFYPGHDELHIEEVEDSHEEYEFDPATAPAGELSPEPNWIRLFRGAVRPGGELILVDFQAALRVLQPSLRIQVPSGDASFCFRAGRPDPWDYLELSTKEPPSSPQNLPQDDLFTEDMTEIFLDSDEEYYYSEPEDVSSPSWW